MIAEFMNEHKNEILQTYADLHKIPEWGFEEFKTSAYLQEKLKAHGITVTKCTETGFIAEVEGKETGPCIGLRADIDALPFTNDKGETCYIHACGHDSHATMAMWTLIALKELKLVKHGKVRGIFQPAEEKLTGALSMIKAGAAKGLDELYGVHIRPIQELRSGQAAPALWHGGSTMAEVVVHGHPAHGARPHLGANAIDGAALVILAINSIWLNPAEPWSAKVTRMHSGGAIVNLIPDKAVLSLDIRAASNALMEELLNKIKIAITGAASAAGCTAELIIGDSVPAADYDQSAIDALAVAIATVLGKENLLKPIITPGSDDFHQYKVADSKLRTAFLALGSDAKPGLHDPHMSFNTEVIIPGTNILVEALASRVK
ncbi:MAG: amidohydrolase [Acidaminococcaceae bacterium]|nr:amidohydrolase [Acidaminococcaceae bacterium]